mmetsp:Transcript_49500/g.146208  ORF Transcript_49500/g.146208 Transcript_49500/m.146208 type:complete len:214 (-) Transcript_49500:1633-2274(-)
MPCELSPVDACVRGLALFACEADRARRPMWAFSWKYSGGSCGATTLHSSMTYFQTPSTKTFQLCRMSKASSTPKSASAFTDMTAMIVSYKRALSTSRSARIVGDRIGEVTITSTVSMLPPTSRFLTKCRSAMQKFGDLSPRLSAHCLSKSCAFWSIACRASSIRRSSVASLPVSPSSPPAAPLRALSCSASTAAWVSNSCLSLARFFFSSMTR